MSGCIGIAKKSIFRDHLKTSALSLGSCYHWALEQWPNASICPIKTLASAHKALSLDQWEQSAMRELISEVSCGSNT